jgi:hypothetical protein
MDATHRQNDLTFLMDIAATNRLQKPNDALCFRIRRKLIAVTIPRCPGFTKNSPLNRVPVVQTESIKILTNEIEISLHIFF